MTVTVQLAPTPSKDGQVLVSVNTVDIGIEMCEIPTMAPVLLVTVTGKLKGSPGTTNPKAIEVGETVNTPAPPPDVPVPLSATV